MSSVSIDRAHEEIDAAWLRSDADGITQHLAEDAVLMPPHDTKKVGWHDCPQLMRKSLGCSNSIEVKGGL